MERVLALATRLLSEGVDASVDQFMVDPPGGWPFWTEQAIAQAEFVLLVCTDTYRQRVEQPLATPQGAGVFWEVNVIRSLMYAAKGVDTRFIPVYYGEGGDKAVPVMIQGATRYRIDSAAEYEALYRRLTNQPAVVKPELGKLVVLPRRTLPSGPGADATQAAASESTLSQPAAFKRLAPHDCSEGGLKSLGGDLRTYIRFDNYLSEPVLLYWLDYDGARVPYGELGPGRSRVQETFATHPWVVTRADGICLGIFVGGAEAGLAVVE
jgi:hypothetical protein